MGHHADGIVFFGYDLGDMTEGWETDLAPDWLRDEEGETGAWWEDVFTERVGKPPRECDFELGFYGHTDSETYYFAAIKSSVVEATYECKPLTLAATWPSWQVDELRHYMERLQLPIPDASPKWYVTSTYG